MAHTIELDDLGITCEIDDPLCIQSWVDALDEYCENIADTHFRHRYQSYGHHEPGKEEHAALCEAVINGVNDYRKQVSDGHATFEDWNNILAYSLSEKVEEMYSDFEDVQYQALEDSNFEDLYMALDEAMSKIEGPVCDLDVLWEHLKEVTLDKMNDKDDSTIYDMLYGTHLTLAYTPGLDENRHDRSDHMIYDNLASGPDDDLTRFLTLYRLPGKSLIDALTQRQAGKPEDELLFDYRDNEMLDKWSEIIDLQFDLPALTEADDVLDIIENGSTYQLPMWCGRLTLTEIQQTDFSEPVYMKGGMIGGVDFINGAGQVHFMHGILVLDASENFTVERGYTVKSIFDYSDSDMNADITNIRPKELDKEPLVEAHQMSMAL